MYTKSGQSKGLNEEYNENLLFKTFTCPSGSSDANIQTKL